MRAKSVIDKVFEIVKGEHAGRINIFGSLVWALLKGRCVKTTVLANELDGTFKHQVKRVYRFFRNEKLRTWGRKVQDEWTTNQNEV